MHLDWTVGDLAEGLRRYHSGQYFAAHESWEAIWLTAPEPYKTFLQGIIQVTAAFEHHRRGNPLGIQRLLENALRRLDPLPPTFGGLNLALLRNDIRAQLHLLASEPTPHPTPPRILPLPS